MAEITIQRLRRGARIYRREGSGNLYLARTLPGGGRSRISLGTEDTFAAIRAAVELLEQPVDNQRTTVDARPLESLERAGVTVSQLAAKYLASPSSQGLVARKDVVRAIKTLERIVGPGKAWARITPDTWREYSAQRRKEKTKRGTFVRAGTVAHELAYIRAMSRWAVREGITTHQPFALVRIPQEKSPVRATLGNQAGSVVQKLLETAKREGREPLYRALWIAIETGRRLSAVIAVRWDDIDLEQRTIRWRAETDKTRAESVVPFSKALWREMVTWRQSETWVCLNPETGRPPVKSYFSHGLRDLFKSAKIPRPAGGGWHMFRRQFVNDRKDASVKDLMALGGWTQPSTVLGIYQQADEETMRAVLEKGSKNDKKNRKMTKPF